LGGSSLQTTEKSFMSFLHEMHMTKNVYYAKFFKVFVALGVILFAWAGIELIIYSSLQNAIAKLFVAFVLLFVALSVRVVTSPDGISYYNSNLYVLSSTWDNVEKIDFAVLRLFGKQRCVFLKNPYSLGWWTVLAWASSKEDREKTIPIDGWNKADQLLADIRHYAPQVKELNE
jgi:hypothetical protein